MLISFLSFTYNKDFVAERQSCQTALLCPLALLCVCFQPELVVTNNLLDLPPPSPPKPKTIVLPPNWKTARDPEGKIYYYHVVTR